MKNQRRPKILILTSSFPRGPEDETCGYVREFARRIGSDFQVRVLAPSDNRAEDHQADGHPPDVFTLTRAPALLPRALDPLQASADFNLALGRRWPVKIAALVSVLSFFIAAFREALSADVICSHWMLPSGLTGAVIARLTRKPHIVIEHSGALHLLIRMKGGRLLARFIVNSSRRVITVSADLKDKLLGLCPDADDKIDVLPMGVNLNQPCEANVGAGLVPARIARRAMTAIAPTADSDGDKPAPCVSTSCVNRPYNQSSSGKNVLFIGRLIEIKGVEVLLEALQYLDGARLIVAGDGELRQKLEARARRLSVDATFLGRVGADERERLVSASDVVVIPSLVLPCGRTEGLPVVCLEAMALGCPVIASNVGGLAEIIVEGQNGLLFEPGNHRMLADKLNLILSNPEMGLRLAENARQTVAAYDWSRLGESFLQIIKIH